MEIRLNSASVEVEVEVEVETELGNIFYRLHNNFGTKLSCFNVKTNCFNLRKLISLVRLKRISSLG